MEETTQRLGIDHHVTLAYAPWSNGAIERVGRELLWTLRSLIDEMGLEVTDWDLLVPLVQFVLNHRSLSCLNGRSPIEVMTGRKPRTAVDMAVWNGTKLTDATNTILEFDNLEKIVSKLAKSIDDMQSDVANFEHESVTRRIGKNTQENSAYKFQLGDYVLVSGKGNSRHVKRRHKAATTWQGPYQIISSRNVTTLGVRMVGSKDKPKYVHWTRLKRFCGSKINLPIDLVEQAQRGAAQFEVAELRDIRTTDESNVEVLISWEGFPATYDSWESAIEIFEDVGHRLLKFLELKKKDNREMNSLYDQLKKRSK